MKKILKANLKKWLFAVLLPTPTYKIVLPF